MGPVIASPPTNPVAGPFGISASVPQGTRGRNVDVPVDMPDGRTLAVEVKHYLEWRTLKLSDGSTRPVKGEVPLNDGIVEQINKDLTLRRLDPTYDPRWVFLYAPP